MGGNLNQRYIKTPVTRRGKIKLRKVQNIGLVKGVQTFLLDQQYAFQCAPMGDTEASMTVIRMTIPKGTPVERGYSEIRHSLHKMGYDAFDVCTAMGFDEVVVCPYKDGDCCGVSCDLRGGCY